ncbi:MAG: hypothetical protein JWQ71_2193 [Pedosphaera sp.]|nr:hypothetical protein [Pedosphaera sp.]
MSFPPPTPKQARVLWFSLTALAVTVSVALVVLSVWGLSWALNRLSAVLLPVAFALILAYILDPVVEFFVRKKVPRLRAILLVYLLGLLIFAGIIGSVIPGLIHETRKLVDEFPETRQTLRVRVESFLQTPLGKQLPAIWHRTQAPVAATPTTNTIAQIAPQTQIRDTNSNTVVTTTNRVAPDAPFSDAAVAGLTKIAPVVANWFTEQLSKVTTWAEFLIGFILVPVFLFYFLLEKKGINSRWTDYLPIQESKAKTELVFILKSINDCMIVFFRGQVLVALCVGALLSVSYLVLGLNYAVLLGAVAAVIGIIPYIGAIISLVLALTVAAVQFGDWTHPLLVLAIAAAVKMLEDFVIGPKIIGERSGLHPLTIIIAVMVGTTLLGGIMGAILAIPLTAVLRTLMFRYVWKKRPTASKILKEEAVSELAS